MNGTHPRELLFSIRKAPSELRQAAGFSLPSHSRCGVGDEGTRPPGTFIFWSESRCPTPHPAPLREGKAAAGRLPMRCREKIISQGGDVHALPCADARNPSVRQALPQPPRLFARIDGARSLASQVRRSPPPDAKGMLFWVSKFEFFAFRTRRPLSFLEGAWIQCGRGNSQPRSLALSLHRCRARAIRLQSKGTTGCV